MQINKRKDEIMSIRRKTLMHQSHIATLLGSYLRLLRHQRKLTLIEASEQANIDTSYLSYAERGEHTLSLFKLMNLCDCYEMKISELFKILEENGLLEMYLADRAILHEMMNS